MKKIYRKDQMSSMIMKRKIDLFNKLYKEISGHGINGDTELAHINKYEAVVLKAMGGSGTVNNITGLKEYWGDDPEPAPAPSGTTTVKQVSDLPEYFKPYVEELFAVSQDVYDRPYVPFGSKAVRDDEGNWSVEKLPDIINPETGEAVSADKRLADVTAEQKAAFAGLRDMFTQVDPETGVRSFRDPSSEGFKEATRLSERGAKGFDELEEKKQEDMRRKRQGAARMANALGGGRFGAEQAMASFYDQQLLDDIQKKGLQESWTEGLKVFDSDRSAARAGSTQRAGLTTDELTSGLKSLGALQSTGETQRAIAQQPLDMNYEEFARQQQFPKQNLQELSGILRGFQVQPTTYQTSQQYKPPQSLGQQLLAAGTLGAGISKGLGKSLLGAKGGGLMALSNGGESEVTEEVEVKETYIPRDVSQIPGLKGIAARTLQRSKGYDEKGNPLETADQALKKRRKAIEGQYPSAEKQEENWRRTLRQMPPKSDTTSMPQIILRNQAENMVKDIETSKVKKDDEIKIPEGAADELTQQEFLEQITTTSTPSDSDSGWDITKILEGFGEGFEAAAPYLASFAKQKGWDDSAEGLKGISDAALKKAQVDYYKGLGAKAKAYEAIERLKTNRALTKEAVSTEIKTLELRLKDLQAKEEFTGLEDDEKVERDEIIRALNKVRLRFGAFPASISTTSGRATKESP
mgnify:CR=1 FL=1